MKPKIHSRRSFLKKAAIVLALGAGAKTTITVTPYAAARISAAKGSEPGKKIVQLYHTAGRKAAKTAKENWPLAAAGAAGIAATAIVAGTTRNPLTARRKNKNLFKKPAQNQ